MSLFSRSVCIISTLVSTLAIASPALAQASYRQVPESNLKHGLLFSIGVLGIDDDKAYEQGVGDSATVLDIAYHLEVGPNLAFIAGLTAPIIDDEDPFIQVVEDDWDGDRSRESSDIDAWGILLEASVRFPINQTISFGGGLGLRSLDTSREISYCSDCYSEDVDLDGGAYIRPYINIDTGNFNMQFSYAAFFSGDYTSGALANFIWNF